MSSLSLFQLLLRRAAETVVKHVADGGRPLLGDIKRDSEEHAKLLIPLLKVLVIRSTWPKCLQDVEYPTNLLAEELVIQLKPWMVFTGDALDRLSSEPCSGCSFPLARSLTLNFIFRTSQEDFDVKTPMVKANAFLDRLLQMAPVASEITLEGGSLSSNFSAATKPQVANLVTHLYRQYNHITHCVHFSAEFTGPQLSAIKNLVHFNYTAGMDSEQALQLARHSALTLQSLVITFDKPLYDKGSVNPLNGCGNKNRLPVFVGATPFPGLSRLCLDIDYPFGDDTLFRGSGDILECASLQLDFRAYKTTNRVMTSKKRFKTWVFSDSPKCNRHVIVSCLIVVAMVCSVLDCVSPQAGNSSLFMGDMDDSLVLHGLSQHLERMWRAITE
ncbi:hypothetical protein GGI17_004597 [Coemansia sp. S146]|nr:hypothetical protein GGI17_004597 [Coemansia sp. S146]